ncbi:tyrosine-type recombinase/integrase [Nitriliruptor alkaliphilus]|uniref:site-specific integrase n=1 Tax=Nitriliruptor alkaliphilus TaxID=427918 RepID=UPI0006971D91|nr:tyrosine-type recombinase/integrase [Nitriliruptor alkaliphilus]
MKGSVFKRCSGCGRRVEGRRCAKCGATTVNWAFRVKIAKDDRGRWRETFRSGFETKRDADRALTELLASLHQGGYVANNAITLGNYLTEEWLPATAPPRVKHSTWNDRRLNLELHVVAHIGAIRLQDLTSAHLNRLYADLMVDGRRDDTGGLSATTVRRIHAMLRKALNDAVRWGLLERNPAVLADPPAARIEKAAQRRRMQTWNADELRRFLQQTEGDELHTAWFMAASTGIRRSELLGLRWSDLDLEAAHLQVRRTVVPGPDGVYDFILMEEQKSSASARTIHLDGRTVAVLRAHKAAMEEVRPWRTEDHDLVFPRLDGRWWNPPAITQAFRRAVLVADVPRIRLHDLRHTHATLLLRAGVNPKVVSERLGHSSVAFTLDTYAHVMPGMQPEAAEQFMDAVFGGQPTSRDAEQRGPNRPTAGEPDDDPRWER